MSGKYLSKRSRHYTPYSMLKLVENDYFNNIFLEVSPLKEKIDSSIQQILCSLRQINFPTLTKNTLKSPVYSVKHSIDSAKDKVCS